MSKNGARGLTTDEIPLMFFESLFKISAGFTKINLRAIFARDFINTGIRRIRERRVIVFA